MNREKKMMRLKGWRAADGRRDLEQHRLYKSTSLCTSPPQRAQSSNSVPRYSNCRYLALHLPTQPADCDGLGFGLDWVGLGWVGCGRGGEGRPIKETIKQ